MTWPSLLLALMRLSAATLMLDAAAPAPPPAQTSLSLPGDD